MYLCHIAMGVVAIRCGEWSGGRIAWQAGALQAVAIRCIGIATRPGVPCCLMRHAYDVAGGVVLVLLRVALHSLTVVGMGQVDAEKIVVVIFGRVVRWRSPGLPNVFAS